MMRATLLLWLFAGGLAHGADSKAPDLRLAVKQLDGEAREAGDWWTALQCEAYSATKLSQRLSPVLGNSDIIGDPIFAFPSTVQRIRDQGERIVVVSTYTAHVIAPDGRPLNRSLWLGVRDAQATAISFDGDHVAACNMDAHGGILVASSLISRKETLRVNSPGNESSRFLWDRCVVANDGSAMACTAQFGAVARVLVGRTGEDTEVTNFSTPLAIGSQGRWLIAERTIPATGELRCLLRVNRRAFPINDWAEGPGVACVLMNPLTTARLTNAGTNAEDVKTEGAESSDLLLIASDGTPQAVHLPFNLGKKPEIATIGRWLLVQSGTDAPMPAFTDLAGNQVRPTATQPNTYAVFAWSDVVDEKNSRLRPAWTDTNSSFRECRTQPASFYTWKNSNLFFVDLTGSEPTERIIATFPQPISWAQPHHNLILVTLADQTHALLNGDGQILWTGPELATIAGPDYAVISSKSGEPKQWSVLRLDGGPDGKRPPLRLPISGDQLTVQPDAYHRLIEVRNTAADQPILLNANDATPLKFDGVDPAILIKNRWDMPGRFAMLGGRIWEKSRSLIATKSPLAPQDAMIYGSSSVVILDSLAQLWIPKSRSEFTNLGMFPTIEHFEPTNDALLFINQQNEVIGRFANATFQRNTRRGDQMPEKSPGSWRLLWLDEGNTWQFTPPGGPTLKWINKHNSFWPTAIHSVSNSRSLIVVSPSLVFGIEPSAGLIIGQQIINR